MDIGMVIGVSGLGLFIAFILWRVLKKKSGGGGTGGGGESRKGPLRPH